MEALDHRQDTRQLDVDRNGVRAGAAGFSPDVDEVRTRLGHPAAAQNGRIHRGKFPAVGKGIRSDIEDAHDGGRFPEGHLPAARPQEVVGAFRVLEDFDQPP